ncbi:hypothetical protein PR202_gb12387 [Eleusine coracana subsp. coracana]|uniref:histone acetyltransferase n=1 Tax=Eleusine coracana subsp. coracana TaxID=191504 RepID=A0AAV5EQ45_ELECO|nr:hypothetical protein PR202_gb12387 [Eleusine coracana subsp. coracana]
MSALPPPQGQLVSMCSIGRSMLGSVNVILELIVETQYCDLDTLQARVKAVLSSISSVGSHIDSMLTSAVSSSQNLYQNGILVPDYSIYHGRIGLAFTNAPSCARDVFTGPVFTSQRYAPTGHNMSVANLALDGRPEIFTNTVFAPCVLASPQCSSGHIKDHFPGDAHQIGSPQPSMSGSSSPFSAVCDPTTSSSMVIRSSVDSMSETNGQNLATGCNVNSIVQGQSHQLYGEYDKDFDCTWNQPVEQSNLSNVTTQSHEMLYVGDYTKKRLYPKEEHGVDRYMGMEEKYWHITDTGSYDLPSEVVERSEQISNSTVLMPASPISDESSIKHRPAKRLKSDLPNPVHYNHAGSAEERKSIVNGTHVSRETVKLENPELPGKSPSCSSMEDSNADTNKMLEPGSEDVHNMEAVRSPETRESGETVQSENTELPTKSSCCSSMGDSCDDTDKMLEPGSEDAHRLETLRSQEICAQREETLHNANGDITVKESEAAVLDQTPRGVINSKKRRGASILYTLTAEELRDHMRSLNQHTCLNKVSSEEFQSNEGLPDQNTFENGVDKISICSKCHHLSSSKAKYDKRFNYAETDAEAEWWVQCDKCKAWQHQVCALFNQKIVDEEAEYACAKCFLKEKDSGDISALEPSSILGAWELPRTKLSDHVERRLSERLQWDRQQRAVAAGKGVEEVPGVEGLTLRVVSSADRVLHVLPRFQDFFKEEKYPRNFPYKSKIGYLDYCKKRGFVSCSIWACPSTKRDDYVLYCHPTAQKMPKSDKLRSWYQNMIKKAVKEGVVVERSTLYDFFLQPTNECKANISAACLPYCENDFWPGEAEKLLEKKDDNTSQKKETQVGRLLRVAKRDDRKGNLDDMLLVHRVSY